MKKCHRFSINYQKNKMPKILKCHLHRKLIEQMIDVPSALIANCAQLFFFLETKSPFKLYPEKFHSIFV